MINKNYILDIAQKIISIDSPTGYTKNVISFIEKECVKFGLSCTKNQKGNLIVTFDNNKDYTIGLSSHVDTLGAMVRSIKSDGTLAFTSLGGTILPTYDGEYCHVITRNGLTFTGTFLSNSPAAHVFSDSRTLERNEKNMHIRLDELTSSKQDTLNLGINSGDFIALDPKFTFTEKEFIKSRFLDDKISVAILLGLIEYLVTNKIKLNYNLKLIFSTFEELGHGSSNIPDVDELIAVDMGCVGEDLNCTEYDVSICAKDSSGPYDFDIVNKLLEISKKEKLNYAIDIYPFYSSDVSAALRAGNNIKGVVIGPGVSASHGMERTHYKGVENTLKLLIAYLNN